ncbi:MAG: hypothetical protein PHN22_05125 [Candidatus ainarchaeum sp.]|nr:hypothetical protein [Candidatus ainarchaeum sp.]
MNKKIKFFSIALLALVLVGTVSAALVNYLSNSATADVTVESPLDLKYDNNTNMYTLEPTNGGNTIDFNLWVENRARCSN